jgi:predicted PurR-regulated permease PerM
MNEESSRFHRRPAAIAAALGIAVFGIGAGFAVSGCGSDSNSDKVNNAIDSVQKQASSVQSQISTALTNAQQQAQSVESQAQSQIQSVQSQVSTAKNQYGY